MKNKKEFLSKTLTFIANSIFINLFSKIFGVENTMVAVSIVVVALTLAAIDMKQDLLKRSLLVTALMLMIAVGAVLANLNPFLGLAINCSTILLIIYQLFDHYKGSYYFPFLISYIFLLMSSPVTLDQLPKRAVSVLFGSVYVILVQIVFNRKRYKNTIAVIETTVVDDLIHQIVSLQKKERNDALYHKTNHMISLLFKAIYDNKIQGNYFSTSKKGYIKLTILLDHLNQTLYDMELKADTKEKQNHFLVNMKQLLLLMKDYLQCPKEAQQQLSITIENILHTMKRAEYGQELHTYVLELESLCSTLSAVTQTIEDTVPIHGSLAKHRWKRVDFLSYHFKYALKAALCISVCIFLIDVFHITYGRWIIFPLIAVIQPYYDNTLQKAKHRIVGTVYGIVLFTVLFTFIQDPTLRLNLTILTAYIGVFITKYQYSTALVAISALGSSALRGAGIEILFYRVLFAVIGCIIAMLINRFVFHYKEADMKEDLQSEMIHLQKEIDSLPERPENKTKKYELLLTQKLIECKLRTLFPTSR